MHEKLVPYGEEMSMKMLTDSEETGTEKTAVNVKKKDLPY